MEDTRNKIGVAFVLPSLIMGGGIEHHLLKMLKHFDRTRFALSLVTLFEYPERPNLYDGIPSDVRVERIAFRSPFDVGSWKRFYAVLRSIRPSVVVSSMFAANAAVRILKPFVGYKVITREHNTYTDKRVYHRVIDHMLSYASDAMVAVSRTVADFASRQAWIPREKFTVIHNGIDLDAIGAYRARMAPDVARVRAELCLTGTQKIVLNVARLKPQKNHELLIRAFLEFSKEHPDHVLAIAGDGSERALLEALIRDLGCGACVRLLGRRKDIFAFYAAADFFVLTSRREGFPNVGLEAMAFGLPFISTRVAGVDEFVVDGQNGYIVPSTVDGVAQAMRAIALQSDVDRAAMRANCTRTARRFDIHSIMQTYERLITETMYT